MKKTGTWIWPDRYSDLKIIEVKPADSKFIKSLLVGWDIAELGAPGLLTKEDEWLYDIFEEEPKKEWLLNLFFNKAKLDKETTTYNNPLTTENIDKSVKDEMLYGLPNKEIKKLLLTEKHITLNRDKIFQKVLNSCDLEASGFNPKRGFRLSNLQEIIDSEKQLTKSEITKKRKEYKGQLFLYLQLFVKEASLEKGFYHTYDNYNWKKGKDFGIAENRTRHEWWIHINSDFFSEISDFIDLLSALPSQIKHLSAKNYVDYNKIAEIFNFDKLFKYDSDNIERPDIQLEEIILKSLEYFPTEKTITKQQDHFPFILLLVRIYNAQGRFKEAEKLLKENNLDLFTNNQLEFYCSLPNKYQQIAFYESCICKMVSTGDFDLWRFPDYPKFTDEEIEKFDIYTGGYLLSDPKQKKKYDAEQNKIQLLLKARGVLSYNMRQYLDYTYMDDLNSIYEDLENKDLRQDLDEIMISIIGQINLLSELDYKK